MKKGGGELVLNFPDRAGSVDVGKLVAGERRMRTERGECGRLNETAKSK